MKMLLCVIKAVSLSSVLLFLCITSCTFNEKRAHQKSDQKIPHDYPDKKPDSIDKAIDILMVVLSDEQKHEIKNKTKEELIHYHFSLGLWIRNNFGLWGDNTQLLNELGGGHPDDASHVLLTKLWMKLNEL